MALFFLTNGKSFSRKRKLRERDRENGGSVEEKKTKGF